jgi:hypothetical protein
MALFTAYFDASGNAVDQPFVIVTGYIANFQQWKFFEDCWKNAHTKYGVNLPFHAADLASAISNPSYKHQRNARHDYVALARDPSKANEFFFEVSVLEVTFVHCAVTVIVPMQVYSEVNSLLDLRAQVPPYAVAARTCIELVRDWEKRFDVPEPVECIFEEGDFEQGKFTSLMVDEGATLPIYKKKIDFAGLQGADHYAWERANAMKPKLVSGHIPHRLSFEMQLGAIPKLHLQSTAAHLINICHIKNIAIRQPGVKRG